VLCFSLPFDRVPPKRRAYGSHKVLKNFHLKYYVNDYVRYKYTIDGSWFVLSDLFRIRSVIGMRVVISMPFFYFTNVFTKYWHRSFVQNILRLSFSELNVLILFTSVVERVDSFLVFYTNTVLFDTGIL